MLADNFSPDKGYDELLKRPGFEGRILVTGSHGFIGKALVRKLKELNFDVVEFDIEDGDIASAELNFQGVKHVFHLAAMTFVPKSWESPFEFYRINVMGTVNVMDFCKRNGCAVTLPSTYMYGRPQHLPIDECHPVDTTSSPYHHSKGLSESLCRFYSEKMNVPAVVLRLFNAYGPGQKKPFLIPAIIEQALSDSPSIEVMDLAPRRDYIYIDDIIPALILTLGHRSNFEFYNLGCGVSYSVKDVVATVKQVFNVDKPCHSKEISRPGEIMDTVADISKIRKMLNWSPRTNLLQGITKIKEAMEI